MTDLTLFVNTFDRDHAIAQSSEVFVITNHLLFREGVTLEREDDVINVVCTYVCTYMYLYIHANYKLSEFHLKYLLAFKCTHFSLLHYSLAVLNSHYHLLGVDLEFMDLNFYKELKL